MFGSGRKLNTKNEQHESRERLPIVLKWWSTEVHGRVGAKCVMWRDGGTKRRSRGDMRNEGGGARKLGCKIM